MKDAAPCLSFPVRGLVEHRGGGYASRLEDVALSVQLYLWVWLRFGWICSGLRGRFPRAPVARRTGPALRTLVPGCLVEGVALFQDRHILPTMVLGGDDEFQGATVWPAGLPPSWASRCRSAAPGIQRRPLRGDGSCGIPRWRALRTQWGRPPSPRSGFSVLAKAPCLEVHL
jgi:hypothetical protein